MTSFPEKAQTKGSREQGVTLTTFHLPHHKALVTSLLEKKKESYTLQTQNVELIKQSL